MGRHFHDENVNIKTESFGHQGRYAVIGLAAAEAVMPDAPKSDTEKLRQLVI